MKLLSRVIVLLLVLSPSLASGAAKWSLTPRIYLEEQYDDNLFLTETNEEDDLITTISPGLNLTYATPTENISLDYEFQRALYNDFSDLDYSGHRGRLDAFKDFGPSFSAGIREVFIVSEDPIELTGIPTFETPSVRIGQRNRYTRNILVPEATFTLQENRSIRVAYRNTILRNEADDIADQTENAINALLTFRFNVQNGIEVFYEHINMDYGSTVPPQLPRDFDGDQARGRYTYYFDPRTSAFLEYRYAQVEYKQESPAFFDFRVHNLGLGFSRDLYENVSVVASGGYALRDSDEADDEDTFSGRLDFLAEYKRLDVNVYGETGFGLDFLTVNSFGFNEFWRVGFDGTYQVLERLSAYGFFYRESNDFVDIDRTDKYWVARGGLTYQILRWLFLSFDYEYNKRDSSEPFQSYTDNRVFGRLSAQYDIAEQFQ